MIKLINIGLLKDCYKSEFRLHKIIFNTAKFYKDFLKYAKHWNNIVNKQCI